MTSIYATTISIRTGMPGALRNATLGCENVISVKASGDEHVILTVKHEVRGTAPPTELALVNGARYQLSRSAATYASLLTKRAVLVSSVRIPSESEKSALIGRILKAGLAANVARKSHYWYCQHLNDVDLLLSEAEAAGVEKETLVLAADKAYHCAGILEGDGKVEIPSLESLRS